MQLNSTTSRSVASPSPRSSLGFPVVRPTMRWSWHRWSAWGFARPKPTGLHRDPVSLLNAIQSETEASVRESLGRGGPTAPETISGGETISDSDLSELAIQTWRLQNRIGGLDPEEHKRIRKQLMDSARRFAKILQRFDVEFEDVTGQPYSDGWQEVDVVSWEDQGDETSPVDAGPWVRSTVSPIIRRKGKTVKLGQVVCVDVEE